MLPNIWQVILNGIRDVWHSSVSLKTFSVQTDIKIKSCTLVYEGGLISNLICYSFEVTYHTGCNA